MHDSSTRSGDACGLVGGHSSARGGDSDTRDVMDDSGAWGVQKTEACTVHDSSGVVQRAIAGSAQAVPVTKVYRPGVVMDFRNTNCTGSVTEAVDVSRGVLHDSSARLGDVGDSVTHSSWMNGRDCRAWLVGKSASTVSRSRLNGCDCRSWLVGDCVDVVSRSGPVSSDRGSRLVGDCSVAVGCSRPHRGDSLSRTVSQGPVAISGSRVHRGHGLAWLVNEQACAIMSAANSVTKTVNTTWPDKRDTVSTSDSVGALGGVHGSGNVAHSHTSWLHNTVLRDGDARHGGHDRSRLDDALLGLSHGHGRLVLRHGHSGLHDAVLGDCNTGLCHSDRRLYHSLLSDRNGRLLLSHGHGRLDHSLLSKSDNRLPLGHGHGRLHDPLLGHGDSGPLLGNCDSGLHDPLLSDGDSGALLSHSDGGLHDTLLSDSYRRLRHADADTVGVSDRWSMDSGTGMPPSYRGHALRDNTSALVVLDGSGTTGHVTHVANLGNVKVMEPIGPRV